MSDSQFEDLTSQIYASKIHNQLKSSRLQLSKLVDQREQMRLKIVQLTKIVDENEQQINTKNIMLTKISHDEIRLSKRMVILEQENVQLKEEMLKTEKHYEQVINDIVSEKDELLRINKQLSENLIKIDVSSQSNNQKCQQQLQRRLKDENQVLLKLIEQKEKEYQDLRQKLTQEAKYIENIKQYKGTIQLFKIQLLQVKKQLQTKQLQYQQQSQSYEQLQLKYHNLYEQTQLKSQQFYYTKSTLLTLQQQLKRQQQSYKNIINQNKLQIQSKQLQIEQLTSENLTLKQQNLFIKEQTKLLRSDNQQKTNHIKTLQTKLINQKSTQQLILTQYQQQIHGLKQTLQNLKQSQSHQQLNQLPIAQILFLINKSVKLNHQLSHKMMKQCKLNQEQREQIEKDYIDQLLDKIYNLFPKQLNYRQYKS